MNILNQSSKITLIVESKSSTSNMQNTSYEEDNEYSLLSVYETSENPLIRELIGTYTLGSDNSQAA